MAPIEGNGSGMRDFVRVQCLEGLCDIEKCNPNA
jgi:DNA-binding Xre family transcriptional regulator